MFVCPGRNTARISAYLGSVCHNNCFQIICHLSSFSPTLRVISCRLSHTPISLSGIPLHLPVDLVPSLLSLYFSINLDIFNISKDEPFTITASLFLDLLTSSKHAFFSLSHLTSTPPTNLSGTTYRNFQFLHTNHHHLSFQCTRIIPTARWLDFLKNTNPLIPTMFTTLTLLPPHSLANPA